MIVAMLVVRLGSRSVEILLCAHEDAWEVVGAPNESSMCAPGAGHWESNASGATLLVYDERHTRQLLLKNWCLDDCDNRSHGAAVCYPGTESEQCLFQSARVAF